MELEPPLKPRDDRTGGPATDVLPTRSPSPTEPRPMPLENDAPTPPSPIHCRGCSYDLRNLTTPRCPECGRAFDPADRRTFSRLPKRARLLRVAVRVTVAALVVSLVVGTTFFVWRRAKIAAYDREQAALALVTAGGGKTMAVTTDAPDWLAARLGNPPYLQRVTAIRFNDYSPKPDNRYLSGLHDLPRLDNLYLHTATGAPLRREDVESLRPLTGLRVFDLGRFTITTDQFRRIGVSRMVGLEELHLNSPLDDDALAEVSNLRSLKKLGLRGVGMSNRGAVHLRHLTKLEELHLDSNWVDDAIADGLTGFPRLRTLRLSQTRIGDATIAKLANLPNLRELDVTKSRISNRCIPALVSMPSLRVLHVSRYDSELTPNGLKLLQLSCPQLQIDQVF